MTTLLLIVLLVTLTLGVSAAGRHARARAREAARRKDDREYLEACLNRERTHDFLMEFPSQKFEERFWRGWNQR